MRKILYLVVVLALAACADNAGLSSMLPKKIGEFALEKVVSGQDALLQINKLHGQAILARDGVVATYAGPGKPLMVWISRAGSEKEARRQAGEMVHRMYENPESPFTWRKRMDFNGVPVYPFAGMGQVHLIFYRADLVCWLSVHEGQEREALSAFIPMERQ
ncbi:hypothetical protein [Salidesulfovibrio onnuriiensis]|uniref:hypothetical protein n=1 Tax=Salidesulfovibrio onnuriiensis TaxID=2583823 RepID=UPI0011CA5016|nr:hypothetical protein [Salidesulfovibrio onnuriiensis]